MREKGSSKNTYQTEDSLRPFHFVARTSAMRLRRLVADSLKRLVQLIHFAWPGRLSPENWCFGGENGLFFGFWGYLGCFWRFWGANPVFFLIFCDHVTPPRGRWGFGGHHSFVERQRSGDAPLVARTQQRLVGRSNFIIH